SHGRKVKTAKRRASHASSCLETRRDSGLNPTSGKLRLTHKLTRGMLMTDRTLNMPTDHATVSIKDVWVPESAVLGPIHNGLGVAQAFVHENRIRQAASSLGAAVYCVKQSVEYANGRAPFGTPLS